MYKNTFLELKNNKKIETDIYLYLKARRELKWHNQKEDGQKQEHTKKDQHGKEKIQHFQVAHIVMNQLCHIEFAKTVDIIMGKK